MGIIISRFRRKKTTKDILEHLETNIRKIERDGEYTEQRHKRVIGYVMAYSVGIYVLFAVLYYFMYVGRSHSYVQSVMYASPLLLLPVVVLFLRSLISWYYNWSIGRNRLRLNKMREEKRLILEEVMNTETYKVAKELLDKYGSPDEQSKTKKVFIPTTNVPGNQTLSPIPPATPGQLRQRQLLAIQNTSTPLAAPAAGRPRLGSDRLPRPLVEQNRSALDKVVDYLLKDGPNYRMALICVQCNSHNGMCLFEEFEFVSYTCAYCGRHNAARRQRPPAPALRPPASAAALTPRPPLLGRGDEDSTPAPSSSDSGDEDTLTVNPAKGEIVADSPPSAGEGVKSVSFEDHKSDADKKDD